MIEPKLVNVLIPLSWDFVPKVFFLSLAQLVGFGYRNGYRVQIYTCGEAFVEKCREFLIDSSLKSDAMYHLWLDADQEYPEDTISRLIDHVDSGKLIVGGITPHRADGEPLIYTFQDNWDADRASVAPFSGLKAVDAMGMGGIMTHRKVFELIKPPYFLAGMDDRRRFIGEDIYFYKLAKQSGVEVFCDTDLCFGHMKIVTLNYGKNTMIDPKSIN